MKTMGMAKGRAANLIMASQTSSLTWRPVAFSAGISMQMPGTLHGEATAQQEEDHVGAGRS